MTSEVAKTVLVLFSGGDAPGMNPFLRALVRIGGNRSAATVLGVRDGYDGLIRTCRRLNDGTLTVSELQSEIAAHPGHAGLNRRSLDIVRMDQPAVGGLVGRGGIILGASRCPEFRDRDNRRHVIDLLDDLEADAVVVCGGNGSLTGARLLAEESDLQVLGVPATIDNNVPGSETALGVDTAVNTLVWAIEHVKDSAGSHNRIIVLETMGGGSGELARLSAVAAGTEIVVTPERGDLTEQKMDGIARRLELSMHKGRNHGIVLVAQGVRCPDGSVGGPAQVLAESLQRYFSRLTGLFPRTEVRSNVFGHFQRGGHPTAADRILASQFADAACDAVAAVDAPSGLLAMSNGRIRLRRYSKPIPPATPPTAERLYALQKTLSKW